MYKYIHSHVCVYICLCLCRCTYMCMYIYLYVCMYVCMHACMHACMYVCIYIAYQTHTYTSIHTRHICTYSYMRMCTINPCKGHAVLKVVVGILQGGFLQQCDTWEKRLQTQGENRTYLGQRRPLMDAVWVSLSRGSLCTADKAPSTQIQRIVPRP